MDPSGVDVVSFDLFQTLVLGPFEQPSELLEQLEAEAVAVSRGALVGFRALRQEAKEWARQSGDQHGEEVTLEARYRAIGRRFGLDPSIVLGLMHGELQLEERLARPCAVAQRWFFDALSRDKTVCITSDTYYPRDFIERLLRKNGYHGWHRLYLSSEVGLCKSSGGLFDHLLSDLAVSPSRVLHVGDHPVSDVRRARERGIASWHRLSPPEAFARHAGAAWGPRYDATGCDRLVRGLVTRRFASNWNEGDPPSFVGATREQLGYSLFGPLLLGFSTWLAANLERAGVDRAFFLSRDGKVMQQAYDAIRACHPQLPESRYLYASRRGTTLPASSRPSELAQLLEPAFSPMPLGELLERRFGISEPGEPATRFGFQSWQQRVHADHDRERLLRLLSTLAPDVLSQAATEREALLGYYDEMGLLRARRPALVDIGHQGTLQRAIGSLVGRSDLQGFYFATVPAIGDLAPARARSFLGFASEDPSTLGPYADRIQLFELLFLSDDDSFVRIQRQEGGWVPHTLGTSEEVRRRFARELHQGALEFVGDATELLGSRLLEFMPAPAQAVAPLLRFWARPTAADVACFAEVELENVYSGRPRVAVVAAPGDAVPGLWPEATRVLGGRSDPSPAWPRRLSLLARGLGGSERKLRKLLRDPSAFLRDSRFRLLRRLGGTRRG